MIVVDASVLTDFLLGRPAAIDSVTGALTGREHEPLHAPELIEPETLNALRRLSRGGEITVERAAAAVVDLADVRVLRYGHAPLRERIWELRNALSAYDATYLALAEALEDPVLLTGDRGLVAVARRALGDERVRHVD